VPELQRLMDLTHTHASAALDAAYPARWGAEVTLSFADGEVIDLRTSAFRGSPGWPADGAEIAGKAASLLGDAAAERLLSALDAAGQGERMDPAALASACAADRQ
jgi:hypothetical protein